ncbi:SecDF P1 head subdomain-containing protein [Sphingopyxis sp.]|uniref:SecDF P1 head subdomain-containing protein n=1 Tax=Sphingopyxis sp. TaxID=1908224 RepID=UPI003D6D0D85
MMFLFRSALILALSLAGTQAPGAEPSLSAPATGDEPQTTDRCSTDNPAPECGPGIWIGSLSICGPASVESRLSQDEWSGLPVLTIDLDARLGTALAELTTSLVGKPLPLRFNGTTLIEPIVNEPITGGSLMISGPGLEEMKALQTALRQCKKSDDTEA